MASLTIKNLAKSYQKTKVIHDINLQINDGEFVVLVGPSGCGKSTILRMIAGLEDITGGTIAIDDTIVNDTAPSKREIAMVFQTYALYPHMTVYNNMAFGLRQQKMPKDIIDEKIAKAADILDITDYLDRHPKALSGGQRQRVAIGRAIVREPKVFLFDEPLSNLDAALRVQTRLEIARLHKRLDTTMIYVTHDQVEAMTLADRIVVLKDGIIEQVGSPIELYEKPSNRFVAQFIGSPKMNFFEASDLDTKKLSKLDKTHAKRDDISIGIRPEHLRLCDKKDALLNAKIDVVEDLGEYKLLHFITDTGAEFVAKIHDFPAKNPKDSYSFTTDAPYLHYFNKADGTRL